MVYVERLHACVRVANLECATISQQEHMMALEAALRNKSINTVGQVSAITAGRFVCLTASDWRNR